MSPAHVAGPVASGLPSPKMNPIFLSAETWDLRQHCWGVSSAVNFLTAKQFTSPTCRKDLALRHRLKELRPMYMVVGDAVNSLKRWLVENNDWEEPYYVFSAEVFLSGAVFSVVEQGLKLLKHRVLAAGA